MGKLSTVFAVIAIVLLIGCDEPDNNVLVHGQLLGSDSVENIRIVALPEDYGPELTEMIENVRDQGLRNDPEEIARLIRFTEFTYRRKDSTEEDGRFQMNLPEGEKFYVFVLNTGHAWCVPFVAVQGKEVKLTPGNALW